jgi:ABC-type uncharacterized transport system ATPase subunit
MSDTGEIKEEFRCPTCGNVQIFTGSPSQQIIAVCSSCGTKGRITFSSNLADESTAIRVSHLKKVFGDLVAVDDVSFSVKRGEIFGFLGPNGAGKTTTVRMPCCLISTTSGKATIEGYNISNHADQQKIRSIIGLLPENVGLYGDLSAYKNLDFYGRL